MFTENVIYDIQCTLCGLTYVGEIEHTLLNRLNTYRYDVKNPKYLALYNRVN